MSMHFAPQWVKPIKPTGGSALGSSGDAQQHQPKTSATSALPSSPFPALGQPRSGSPTTASNPPLSYSRVTHTPASPPYQGDNYYSYAGEGQNGGAEPNPFPFRYSREQILAIWDEGKVKERPIELMKMAESEGGSVLVSKSLVKPVGLRDLTENEKKILSTTIHPPMPNRRQPTHGNAHTHGNTHTNPDQSSTQRRGPAPASKDAGLPPMPSGDRRGGGGGAFAGFGRGEGGAFGGAAGGGAKFSAALSDSREGRQPGAIGGGFGGVGKRGTRRDADDPSRPSAASTWRPTRNASGTFEGVLGFGSTAGGGGGVAAGPPTPSDSAEPDANGKSSDRSGWGPAEKQWRATLDDRNLSISTGAPSSVSVIATASATPVAERDALIRDSTPTPSANGQPATPTPQEREDLGALNWYYRDPNGQEQGPFTGSQMHEWYSHSYFQDDLPVRREHENGFHTLSELKVNTGSAVQPFLSLVRPRLPPNLPIPHAALQNSGVMASPGALSESFRHMGIHGPPQPHQPQYHSPSPVSPYPGHFGQPQYGAQPFAQPQWDPAPGRQSPARLNSAYGSIGASPYAAYGGAAAIGTPVQQRAPDVFSPAIGQPSPWGAPAPVNPAAAWQQQQQQQAPVAPQPAYSAPIPQQHSEPEPASYFPPTEEITAQQIEATEPEPQVEVEEEEEEEESFAPPEDDNSEDEVEASLTESKPPTSVWGQSTKSTSRKSSITTPSTTTSKLPPAPASLPAKPAAAVQEEPVVEEKQELPEPVVAEEKTPAAPKPAPWADSKPTPTGPSLREIQEAEARQAAAARQARAAARAAASPANPSTPSEDIPAVMSWGLPTQGSKGAPASVPVSSSTPPPVAWGSASDGPKKTLKQIQEEEEKRREKAQRHVQAVTAAANVSTPIQKRGYADLAAHAPPPSSVPGWTTVGAGGKASSASPVPKPATPVAAAPKPVTPTVVKAAPKAPTSDEPSIEFVRWAKQALTGLQVPIDDFITMLLQFPIDPPAASKGEVQEIIADSVYASSRTLDGRRFAQEFMTRRKADVARPAVAGKKTNSIADVVKAQPKAPAADLGFKVVKAKKKRQA